MTQPPQDSDGCITPHDDVSVDDGDILVRRVPAEWIKEKADGRRKVSKSAFSASSVSYDKYRSVSFDLLSGLTASGIDPSDNSYHPDVEVIVGIRVGDIREIGLQVGSSPEPDNPSHIGVWGIPKPSQMKKILKAVCQIFRCPQDVDV